MIAAARMALRYFMLRPFQRWLLPLGALFCALGLLMAVTGTPGRPLFLLGLIAMQVPGAIVAGVAFRHLSASRAYGLAPRFRITMFASLLLTAAGIAVTWHVTAPLWLRGGDPDAVWRAATLLGPFAVFTLIVLGSVIGSASANAFLAVFAATTMPFYWFTMNGAALLRGRGIDPVLLAAAGAVAAWVACGAWYLSTSRVSAPAWRSGRVGADNNVMVPGTIAAAEASYLTGMSAPSARWAHTIAWTILTAAALLGCGLLLPRVLTHLVRHGVADRGRLAYMLAIMGGILVLQTGAQAAHGARRARLLWLTHASREDLFRLCERRLRRQGAWVTAVCLLLLGPWLLQLFGPLGIAWVLVLILAAVSAGGYLGLMAVKGWRVLDVVIGGVLLCVVYGGIPFVIAHLAEAPRMPAAVLVMLLAIALTCRTIGARRWRSIDWLRMRPLRWLGGYARPQPDTA